MAEKVMYSGTASYPVAARSLDDGRRISIAVAVAAVFVLDLSVPLGYGVSFLYLLAGAYVAFQASSRETVVFVVVCVLAIVAAYLIKAYAPDGNPEAGAFNRVLASVILCALVFFARRNRNAALLIVERENSRLLKEINDRMSVEIERRLQVQAEIENQYSTLVNSVGAVIWRGEPETFRIIYVNPEAETVLGYPAQRWTDEPDFWARHVHPEDAEYAYEYCVAETRRGRDHVFEYRMLAADGRTIWFRDSVRLVWKEGRVSELVGVMIDITERKLAERARLESDLNFRAVCDNARELISILDDRGRRLFCNAAHKPVFGDVSALIGSDHFSNVHAQDQEMVRRMFRETLESGLSTRFDYRLIAPDGTVRHMESQRTLLWSANGEPRRVLAISRDVTDRRLMENRLRASEKALRELLQMLPVAVYVCDVSGTIEQYNQCAAALWGREPAVGESSERFCGALRLYRPDGSVLPHDECPLAVVLRCGEPRLGEAVVIERPDGSRRIAQANSIPLRDADGKLKGAVNCLIDVTDTRKRELQVRNANHLLRMIAENQPRDGILQDLVQSMVDTEPGIMGFILILDQFSDRPQSIIAPRLPAGIQEELKRNCGKPDASGFPAQALLPRQWVMIGDIPASRLPERQKTLAAAHGLLSCWAIPLFDGEGNALGILGAFRNRRHDPDENQQVEMSVVAEIVKVAIEAGDHRRRMQDYALNLRRLANKVMALQEQERRSLSIQLHDTLGQNLTALGINLAILSRTEFAGQPDIMKRLGDSIDMVDAMTMRLDHVMTELRPPMIDDYGLPATLRWYAQQTELRTGLSVRVHGSDLEPRPPAEIELALFRIAQEALTNTVKYAKATRVDIGIEASQATLLMTVEDNGIGISEETRQSGMRWGILGMRERAAAISGNFEISSGARGGTCVRVEVRH